MIDRRGRQPHSQAFHMALLALAGFALLVCALPRAALAADLYMVKPVPVDAAAESATQARARALLEGQREAFRRMLRRLTSPADWPRLPEPDQGTLERAVRGIEIAGERATATRYLATLSVSFDRRVMRALLGQSGIPFTDSQARPTLVIALPPVQEGAERDLWASENPWRDAWAARAEQGSLVPLVLPAGDEADRATLDYEQAAQFDRERLLALARRYRAGSVMVTSVRPGLASMEVTAGLEGAEIERIDETVPAPAGTEGFAAAAAQVHERLEQVWKERNQISAGEGGTLAAYVTFASFAEWQAIRERLASLPEVSRVEITGLSHRDAQLVLHHMGDAARLARLLAQHEMELSDSEGFWTLRLSGGRPRETEVKPGQ
ncbi:MAG: DUF2066 domain-containing protein [Alphaproteobacteria bacterium]|nr:DUF2066 domain-containing protein [Alphaproteobacteria bacterium]